MELLRKIIMAVFIVSLLGCASTDTVKLNYEYDPAIRSATLETYDWLPVPGKLIRYDLIISQIKDEMEKQLHGSGYKKDPDGPDFLLALHGGAITLYGYEDWKYLNDNFEQYAVKRRIDITRYTDDMLVIDVINMKDRELIYRAEATVRIAFEPTPEKREIRIRELAAKVVGNFMQIQGVPQTSEK